jgi:extradiol dioxygenase family protein
VPFPSVRLSENTVIDLFPKSLWTKDNPDEVCRPNLNHFCLAATKADWEQLRCRLQENGISIDEGPVQRWGAHGAGVSIYFRDPEGNVIEVRYYAKEEPERPCLLGS